MHFKYRTWVQGLFIYFLALKHNKLEYLENKVDELVDGILFLNLEYDTINF